ncbi:transcriptional regulator [Jingyaoa shaoxingensis]|uniref:Transcriptional regulator n=1 Tax=Jingyaoa shaoxingensis TaxID=2763671 RepID=A0ABR7NED4_9FIRM|nr:transcriptional regulator [Jingyaoa shaoxingensis]MBC8574018.1 transcriptional regulator [Jingyaoa shaoxingensis]
MQSRKSQGRQSHFRELLTEAMSGEYHMEKLPSPAYDFAEERQAVYYSNMRYNMESDMSVMVMNHHEQLDELKLLKEWKREAQE